jgi:transposase
MPHGHDERRVLEARRSEKIERQETLRLRASSMLVQIRRDLGGGYVEDLAEINIERAQASLRDLADVTEEYEELARQIEELDDLIGG